MSYTYKYPRPMVTVDTIVVALHPEPSILLIQRANAPYKSSWALPGGFVEMNETLKKAAIRELKEETGLELHKLEQFNTYGSPDRDPRGRTISIVYFVFTQNADMVCGDSDAQQAKWFSTNEIPKLAFDHATILNDFFRLHPSLQNQ